MVFQDPLSALYPRQPAWKALDLPLKLHSGLARQARQERIAELFSAVGLDSTLNDTLSPSAKRWPTAAA